MLMGFYMIFFTYNVAVGVITLIVSMLALASVPLPAPQPGKHDKSLLIPGMVLIAISIVMIADAIDESVNEYGGGFDAGNGFLFDGLGVLAYYFVVPVCLVAGIILLTINASRRRQKTLPAQKKVTRSISQKEHNTVRVSNKLIRFLSAGLLLAWLLTAFAYQSASRTLISLAGILSVFVAVGAIVYLAKTKDTSRTQAVKIFLGSLWPIIIWFSTFFFADFS